MDDLLSFSNTSDLGPHTIYSPDGDRYILAATEEAALAEIDQEEEELDDLGWMCVVDYPELYDNREEWEESPDFTDPWWESCQRPADDQPKPTVLRAWEVHYR